MASLVALKIKKVQTSSIPAKDNGAMICFNELCHERFLCALPADISLA